MGKIINTLDALITGIRSKFVNREKADLLWGDFWARRGDYGFAEEFYGNQELSSERFAQLARLRLTQAKKDLKEMQNAGYCDFGSVSIDLYPALKYASKAKDTQTVAEIELVMLDLGHWLKQLEEAYDHAGIELTDEKILRAGNSTFATGHVVEAEEFYRRVESKEGLLKVAEAYVNGDQAKPGKSYADRGLEIFEELGRKDLIERYKL